MWGWVAPRPDGGGAGRTIAPRPRGKGSGPPGRSLGQALATPLANQFPYRGSGILGAMPGPSVWTHCVASPVRFPSGPRVLRRADPWVSNARFWVCVHGCAHTCHLQIN